MAFTLQDINDAAERDFGSTDFELGEGRTLHLVNALRLGDKDREKLGKIQDRLEEDDSNEREVISEAIMMVAKEKNLAKELLEMIGEDMGKLASVFKMYSEKTQVGEASASQN